VGVKHQYLWYLFSQDNTGNPATGHTGNPGRRHIGNPCTRHTGNLGTRHIGNPCTHHTGNLGTDS